MYRLNSSIFILILFVSVYVLSISSYTYICSLSRVELWDKKKHQPGRYKRSVDLEEEEDPWTERITINYCCGKDQDLNHKLECVESKGEDDEKLRNFLAFDNVVEEDSMEHAVMNLTRVTANFEYNKSCSKDDLLVITWWPDNSTYFYVSQKDGSLLELEEDRQTVLSNYSTQSYCVGTMQAEARTLVTLLCPCKENICIKKCCDRGYYFNTFDNKCQPNEDGIPNYQPEIYSITEETTTNNSYHLLYGPPKCHGLNKLVADSFYIQDNGFLMLNVVRDELLPFYDNDKYCVDTFSDGNPNSSYVNGFYCPDDKELIFSYKDFNKTGVVRRIEEESTTNMLETQKEPRMHTVPLLMSSAEVIESNYSRWIVLVITVAIFLM